MSRVSTIPDVMLNTNFSAADVVPIFAQTKHSKVTRNGRNNTEKVKDSHQLYRLVEKHQTPVKNCEAMEKAYLSKAHKKSKVEK